MPVETPGRFSPLFERLWGVWSYLVPPEGYVGLRCDLADGDTIELQRGTVKVDAPSWATLRWGDHLPRPTIAPPRGMMMSEY